MRIKWDCLWMFITGFWEFFDGYTDSQNINASACEAYISYPSNEISCYNTFNTLSNWTDSQSTCTQYGGHIVSVTSLDEREVVVDLMRMQGIDDIWIGAREVPGAWRWPDGREAFEQGCFHDDSTDADFSESFFIGDNNYAVCEAKCKEGGYRFGGLQNRHRCLCGNSFGKHGQSLSCSVLCPDQESTCGGVTSNSVFAVGGTYTHWAKGLPNNHFGYQTCAELETGNEFLWNDAKCNEVRGVICQISDENICTQQNNNFIDWGPNSTACYHLTTETLSWFEAQSHCRELGGALPVIDSEETNDLLVEALLKLDLNGSNYVAGFWFALTRAPWEWLTGEEFVYTSWSNGEPNGDTQHCVTMNTQGEWQDRGCADVWKTICEKDTGLKPSTTTEEISSTTPATTSTTLRLAPVRDSPRGPVYPLEDRYLAAVIAGGVFMLIIVVIVTSIHCHFKCKRRAQKKEDEKDAKREKYFFGFDNPTELAKDPADSPTNPPIFPDSPTTTEVLQDFGTPHEVEVLEEYPTTEISDRTSKVSDFAEDTENVERSSITRDTDSQNEGMNRRSGRLSDKPDVIPDTL